MPYDKTLTSLQQGHLVNECYQQLMVLQIELDRWQQQLNNNLTTKNPAIGTYYHIAQLKFRKNIWELVKKLKDYQHYLATGDVKSIIQQAIDQLEQNGFKNSFEDIVKNLQPPIDQTPPLELVKAELLNIGQRHLDQIMLYCTHPKSGQHYLPENKASIDQQLPQLINSVLFLQGFDYFPPICDTNLPRSLFHFAIHLLNETYGIPPESMQLTADKLALGEHIGVSNLIQHIQQQHKRLNNLEPSNNLNHASTRLANEYKLFIDEDEVNIKDLIIDEKQINPSDCAASKSKETATACKNKLKVRDSRSKSQLWSLPTAFSLIKQKDLIKTAPAGSIILKWLNYLCSSRLNKQGYVAQIAAIMNAIQPARSHKKQAHSKPTTYSMYQNSMRFITSLFYWDNNNNTSLSKFFSNTNIAFSPRIDSNDWYKAQTLYGRIEAMIDLHHQANDLSGPFFTTNKSDYTHLQSAQSCLYKEFQLFHNQYKELEQDRDQGISYKPNSESGKNRIR